MTFLLKSSSAQDRTESNALTSFLSCFKQRILKFVENNFQLVAVKKNTFLSWILVGDDHHLSSILHTKTHIAVPMTA